MTKAQEAGSGGVPRIGLTVEEAAAAAGIGRTMMFKEMKEGRLTARKVGRRTVIPLSELERWLSSQPKAEGVGRAAA